MSPMHPLDWFGCGVITVLLICFVVLPFVALFIKSL